MINSQATSKLTFFQKPQALPLALGLLLTPLAASAHHGGPHGFDGPPMDFHQPPPRCDIPDDRYQLYGLLEQNEKVSVTLFIQQGMPVVIVADQGSQKEYLATPPRGPHHGPRGKCGPHRGEGPYWEDEGPRPHHERRHGGCRGPHPHKPPPPHMEPKICKGTQLTFAWGAAASVPGSLSGKLILDYQNGSLSGSMVLKGNGINVNDRSVTLNKSQ
ncbi:hypothetical protein E1189_15705 [Sansalvadorimonas verongulae]|nr:hypothetical protein [Sansalvadorimonas verongulae]